MKSVRRICAVLVGLVFLCSGLLKLMDPMGDSLVVTEYFSFLHLGFLEPLSYVTGLVLSLLEAVLGAALVSGVWPKLSAVISGVLIGGFTLLTLALWIFNPNMDCGCFGEALHMSHLGSLLKNIALCALWAVCFLPFRSVGNPLKVKYVSFFIACISIVAFALWSALGIPAMDFTPLRPGASLEQAAQGPDSRSARISPCDAEGEYQEEMLYSGSYLVISSYDPDRLSHKTEGDLTDLAAAGGSYGGARLLFLSSGYADAPFTHTADRKSLLTLNRSNGGATLVSDGYIIAKWPSRSLPSPQKVEALLSEPVADAMMHENTPKRLKLQGFLLYVFAVILLL